MLHVFRSTTSERPADRFWRALIASLESISIKATPAAAGADAAALVPSQEISGSASHAGLLRAQGVPVAAFSPIRNRPIPELQHDEWLDVRVFLEGIRVCERVLQVLASLD